MNKQEFTSQVLEPTLELIRTDSKIKRFFFIPGFMSVLFLSVLLVYQFVYTYVIVLEKGDSLMKIVLSFFHSSYALEIIIFSCVFFLLYEISNPIFEGGLIRYVEQKSKGEASRSEAMGYGLVRFYVMFEYQNLFGMFKLISILNAFLFSLRFLGIEYIKAIGILFSIAFLFSVLINLLTSYAKYEIVLEKKGVFEALSSSAQIALLNIKTTWRLYILMFFMNVRVILSFMIVLIFPILLAVILAYISSKTLAVIAFILLGIVFFFILIMLAYLAAVLEVFTTSMWFYAYKEGKSKLE